MKVRHTCFFWETRLQPGRKLKGPSRKPEPGLPQLHGFGASWPKPKLQTTEHVQLACTCPSKNESCRYTLSTTSIYIYSIYINIFVYLFILRWQNYILHIHTRGHFEPTQANSGAVAPRRASSSTGLWPGASSESVFLEPETTNLQMAPSQTAIFNQEGQVIGNGWLGNRNL